MKITITHDDGKEETAESFYAAIFDTKGKVIERASKITAINLNDVKNAISIRAEAERRTYRRLYTMTIVQNHDGTTQVSVCNDGYNPLELLGLYLYRIDDIKAQAAGKIKPDIIKRQVIDRREEGSDKE